MLEPDQHPVARVTEARMKAFIDAYAPGRAPFSVATIVHRCALFLTAIDPPDGALWLTRLGWRMINEAEPARPKFPRMAPALEIIAAS